MSIFVTMLTFIQLLMLSNFVFIIISNIAKIAVKAYVYTALTETTNKRFYVKLVKPCLKINVKANKRL